MSEEQASPLRPTALDILAHKIDSIFSTEERLLAELGSTLLRRLTDALEQEKSEPRRAILVLQLNAYHSIIATLELWRRGFALQSGVLLRNVVETIVTAALLNSDPKAYEAYKRGSLKSSKSFTKVKSTWPEVGTLLGKVSGSLSNQFTHLGEMYKFWNRIPLDLEEQHILALRTMLLPIKICLHSLDLLSEMTCYNYCAKPRFMKRIKPNMYQYDPTAEGQQWMEVFLVEHVTGKGGSDGTTR